MSNISSCLLYTSGKKKIATTAGTLSTTNGMFVFLLIVVVLLIGALSFFPALALGPLAAVSYTHLEKGSIFDDALDDTEYEGNLIYLLKSGSEFIRTNSKVRFVKEAQYRVDKPDYAERAVTRCV